MTDTAILAATFSNLDGPAGTGKTYFLRQWAEALGTAGALTATTGIAAVNLGEGTTIHSLLHYFDTNSLIEQFQAGFLTATLKRLYRAGLRRILLDEKSMLDADQLTVLARALDEVNGEGYDLTADPDDEAGTGTVIDPSTDPLCLTLAGDFAQLPPVKGQFAFQSPEWPRFAAATIALSGIWRQTDQDFLRALQQVRRGRGELAYDQFQPCFRQTTYLQYPGTTIFAKNLAVDRHNGLRLDKLKTSWVLFQSSRWGQQRPEWKQIPEVLRLKPGALVMILANQRKDGALPGELQFDYVNGDLGTLEDDAGNVTLQRTGQTIDVACVTRPVLVPLEAGRRKELRSQGLEDRIKDKFEIVGEISYMPLRAAWGSTVHKCQGLTLTRVQINIRDHFFAHPGMLYVALSRCRSLEGIDLVGTPNLFVSRATVDPRVREWL